MTKTIDFQEAYKMLGEEYEAALECCWAENEWEYTIELSVFLKGWTKYVEEATQTKCWLDAAGK